LVNLRQAFRHAPAEPASPPRRLLVHLTGGPEDQRLLEIVQKIAIRPNTEITLAYVVEVEQSMPLDAELPSEVDRGEEILHAAETQAVRCVANRAMLHTELLQARAAGPAIVDEAIEERSNAILLSCRLRKRHGRVSTGETVDYVLRNAPCEVIVVRGAMTGWEPESGVTP
jgi:nucleotide-binding universal stress UspA family protein